MITVRAEHVMLCQGGYLTTVGYLMTSWYLMTHCYVTILLVIEDSFGKLMMLLVIEDFRVLEKIF